MPRDEIRPSRRLETWRPPSAGRALLLLPGQMLLRAGPWPPTSAASLTQQTNWSGRLLGWLSLGFSGSSLPYGARGPPGARQPGCSSLHSSSLLLWGWRPHAFHSSPAAHAVLSPPITPCASAPGENLVPRAAPHAPRAPKPAPHSPRSRASEPEGDFLFVCFYSVFGLLIGSLYRH